MPVTLAHVHDRVVKLLVDSGNSNQMCVILKEAVSNTEGSILSQVLLRIKELQRQVSALSSQVSCPLQKSPPQCVYPVNLCLNIYSNKNFSFFFPISQSTIFNEHRKDPPTEMTDQYMAPPLSIP